MTENESAMSRGEIMLNIIFGKIDDVIYNTSVFFKNTYEKEWLLEEETKQMILDIDKSKVLGNGAIESPVLGIIGYARCKFKACKLCLKGFSGYR